MVYVPLGYSQTFAQFSNLDEVRGGELRLGIFVARTGLNWVFPFQDPPGELVLSLDLLALVSLLPLRKKSRKYMANSFTGSFRR